MAQTTHKDMSRARLRVDLSVSSSWRGTDDIENTSSSFVACCIVFTELLPGNVLIKSVTIISNAQAFITGKNYREMGNYV
jgi:hypothetical protein